MIPLLPPHPKGSGDDEWLWLLTYADMVTLIMAFFILLSAISKVDESKFEEVKASMAAGVGKRDVEKPMDALRTDINDLVTRLNLGDKSGTGVDSNGVFLDIASSALFASGSAVIREETLSVIAELAIMLKTERYRMFQVEVQGHTDDAPITTPQFPSNWELSASRATGVVRALVENGILSNRLRAVGFADVAPKVPNRGPDGKPLPDNREINRRITVRISPR